MSVTFGAVGDIVLSGPTAAEMARRGTSWPLGRMRETLAGADVLFGNLECVIVPPDYPEGELDTRDLVTRYDGTEALREAGFDVLSLANNHILDGGTSGMFNTRDVVEHHEILACGIGESQADARRLRVLERSGLRWGFLCYAEDSNYALSTQGPCYAYYEPDAVLEDIAAARDEVDVLVVSVHADLEFVDTPSVPRRQAFREFARAGATLVLGHHPHVLQGVEHLGGSLIAYSLGNFLFHAHTSAYLQTHLPATARSFVLLVDVARDGVRSFTRVPVAITPPPDQRPQPAEGAVLGELERRIEELDRLVLDDNVVAANWRAASLERLVWTLKLAASDRPEEALHLVGRLLFVAENRAWVDEVVSAAAEAWEAQRAHVDHRHRPSFASKPRRSTAQRKRASALARRLRRLLG
jgi:poly-gamma-glutamate synthesis protein (capsule biosynthesis protein)